MLLNRRLSTVFGSWPRPLRTVPRPERARQNLRIRTQGAGRKDFAPLALARFALLLGIVGVAAPLSARPGQDAGASQFSAKKGEVSCSASADLEKSRRPLAESPSNLDAIFAQLEKMKGFEASFEEKKHLALLKAPLTSKGKLYYMAPGKLVRWVQEPEQMKITVSGGQVRIEDASGTRNVDLSSRPGVAAFVSAFSRFLDGDQETLSEHFRLRYERGPGSQWTLTMTPRKEPLTHVVKSMQMRGTGTKIGELVVEEKNGDRSVTVLTQVDDSRQFSEQEKKRIFEN